MSPLAAAFIAAALAFGLYAIGVAIESGLTEIARAMRERT
jgi:hypothetical protein